MNTQVTSEQIEFYRENGFLVIDDFLRGAELSLWQDAVDAAVAQFMHRDDMYHNQRGEESYYGNVWFFHIETVAHSQISLKSKTKYQEFSHVVRKCEWKNRRVDSIDDAIFYGLR